MLTQVTLLALLAALPPSTAPQEAALDAGARRASASPAIDLRQTSIRVVEGIRGGIVGPPRYRTLLIHWDCNTGGYRAVEQGRNSGWLGGPQPCRLLPVRAGDVSLEDFRGLTRRLCELGVLDLPLGDPDQESGADGYRRDTSIAFCHDGRAWMNSAPGGCVGGAIEGWPSLDEERRFQRALDAIEGFVAWDELAPDPAASLLQFSGSGADLDALAAAKRSLAAEAIGKELDLQRAYVQVTQAGRVVWLGIAPDCLHQLGEAQVQVDGTASESRLLALRRAVPGALAEHRAGCSPPLPDRGRCPSSAGFVSLGMPEALVTETWGAPDARLVDDGAETRIYREAAFDIRVVLRAGKVDGLRTVPAPSARADEPIPEVLEAAPTPDGEIPRDAVLVHLFSGPRPSIGSMNRLLLRRRDGYADELGFVPSSEIASLRAALLASREGEFRIEALRRDPCPLLEALGISAAAFEAHQQELVEALCGRGWGVVRSVDVLPEAARKHLSYEALAELAAERLVPFRSSDPSRIALELPGSPALSVEAVGAAPVFLPLRIRAEGAEWDTADPELVRRLAVLMPPSQERDAMAQIFEYCRTGVWASGALWGSLRGPLREALDAWGPELLPAESLGPELRIDRWEIRPGGQGPRLHALHAAAADPASKVRGVRIVWPMDGELVAARFRQAQEAAATHPALAQWLRARPRRFLELCLDPLDGAAPSGSSPGLGHRPTLSLLLFETLPGAQRDWQRGTAWVGERADETVIVPCR